MAIRLSKDRSERDGANKKQPCAIMNGKCPQPVFFLLRWEDVKEVPKKGHNTALGDGTSIMTQLTQAMTKPDQRMCSLYHGHMMHLRSYFSVDARGIAVLIGAQNQDYHENWKMSKKDQFRQT
jgi:hypothetical protein